MAPSDSKAHGFTSSIICSECNVILQSLNDAASKWSEAPEEYIQDSLGTISLQAASTKITICHLCASLMDLSGSLEYEDDEVKVVSTEIPNHIRNNSAAAWDDFRSCTWSPRVAEIARDWLKSCNTDHKECFAWSYPAVLPTRLIDIGEGDAISPRLIESSSIGASQRYVTLSHCWGGGVPLSLKQSNVAEFTNGIEYELLPKTFQHALIVTREIGCRYIWIDSLCIVQDSKEDWLQESSKMNQVYSYSYCTIAASIASDATKGLFYPRHPYSVLELSIEINQVEYLASPNGMDLKRTIDASLLNSRAWVYQERFLSPRTLHFGSQLFWECLRCSDSEENPHIIDASYLRPSHPRLQLRQVAKSQNQMWDDLHGSLELWDFIINQYSRCKLTKSSDRLVAISGVAMEESKVFGGDDYLAGMWRRQLPYSLVWSTDSDTRKSVEYIAPSWSWASLTGLIYTPTIYGEFYSFVEVIDIEVLYVDSSKFGQVRDGFIKLKGGLISISSRECKLGGLAIYDDQHKDTECSGCICKDQTDTIHITVNLDITPPGCPGLSYRHFPVSLNGAYRGQDEIFIMPVLGFSPSNGEYREGLVLQATGQQNGEFRRIGQYGDPALHIENPQENLWQIAFNSFRARAEELGVPVVSKDKPGYNCEYVITIV